VQKFFIHFNILIVKVEFNVYGGTHLCVWSYTFYKQLNFA